MTYVEDCIGLGKTGRGAGVGGGDLWIKPGDGELGDTGGNFFLVHLFWISRSDWYLCVT